MIWRPWFVCLALLVSSCGLDLEEGRVGPVPLCDTTSRGMLILMAQALPESSYVPCFRHVPDDWALESADIEAGFAELVLARDGVGDLEIEFDATCQPRGEQIDAGLPSDVEVFQAGDVDARRWLVFPGGCVSVESTGGLDLSAFLDAVSLIARDELRELSGLEL